MNWILAQEFWLWVILGIVTVIVGKTTGKTVSQRIQGFFGQFIDYVIMFLIVGFVWFVWGQYQATIAIRYITIGHWFWHEDSGGTITRGWIIEKLKELWEK